MSNSNIADMKNKKNNRVNIKQTPALGKRAKRTEKNRIEEENCILNSNCFDNGEEGTMGPNEYCDRMRTDALIRDALNKSEKIDASYRAIYANMEDEDEQSEEDQIANIATRVSNLEYAVEPDVQKRHTENTSKKTHRNKILVRKDLLGFSSDSARVVSGNNILESKEKIQVLLTKTQMCKHIIRPGGCRFKDVCRFAHSLEELQDRRCAFGNNCRKKDCEFCITSRPEVIQRFQNQIVQERIAAENTPPAEEFNKTKTKLCAFYEEKGTCPRETCDFAHGNQELRCGYGLSCRNRRCTRIHPMKPGTDEIADLIPEQISPLNQEQLVFLSSMMEHKSSHEQTSTISLEVEESKQEPIHEIIKEMSEKQIEPEIVQPSSKKLSEPLNKGVGAGEEKVEIPVKVKKTRKEKVEVIVPCNTDGAWDD